MDHRKSLLLNKTKTIGERHNPSFHTDTYLSPNKVQERWVETCKRNTVFTLLPLDKEIMAAAS
ncbi:unnamed protein product, partial [Timema podura]|nr:unnamed protein product [Timema podura]